ncbi:hypothetical protein [Burkholderia gladioli]|uniref:hypothetical protein n=1 Tax=Burkholderia gladioli TaxID=28095 RepID=UPI0016413D41|nr:hypothetical protein [Burkholderia gladioli]
MAHTSKNPYLEIRCSYVLANFALISDPNGDGPWEALMDAQAIGYRDCCDCQDHGTDMDVPAFFADVKALRQEWLDGWRLAEDMRDMQDCGGCNNSRGEPCPIHG